MGRERAGLAQTPQHVRFAAGALAVFALAMGVYASFADRPLFWLTMLLFLTWSVYFLRLAQRWQREDENLHGPPGT